MRNLAEYAQQLGAAIHLHARLANEGERVLHALQDKVSELNQKLAPIHDRATALTWAEENITRTKAETNELLKHIDTTRKVETILRLGPGRSEEQLEPFLVAVGRLEEALSHLEGRLEQGNADALQQAYDHASALYKTAMRDCEADFAAVLAQHGAARLPSAAWLTDKASPAQLRDSLSHPELQLLPPPAVSRVSRLAETMLRARHVSCLDTYAQARSRALDMLLALVGLDPSALPAAGGALQGAEQLQRLVGAWSLQLRVLLVGAAAELALAQDVWPSPDDEFTFSKTISRSLLLVLQVGKAVCEGRASGRTPDRIFVLLHMHQSLADLLPYLNDLLSSRERCTGLLNEAHMLGLLIGRAARQLFTDFEEGVGARNTGSGGGGSGPPRGASLGGSDAVSKLTMLDGTVHPICATTLSFLKRLFTFPNALPLLFGLGAPGGGGGGMNTSSAGAADPAAATAAAASASSSIMRILMRLLEILEAKARAYKQPALGDLLLMNNVHYMVWTVEQATAADKLQKQQQAMASTSKAREREDGEDAALETPRKAAAISRRKGAAALAADPNTTDAGETEDPPGGTGSGSAAAPSLGLSVLGSAWVERHKDIVEHYGAAYQEKTWRPLIAALEAVLVTEEDPEPSDPGRFKAWLKSKFAKLNTQLDTIAKQQASWTIPDAKLKAAVRKVIKQDVLPLYREFWKRYTAVDFTTHPDKYLRYPPEQLEHIIDHSLFEGRAAAAPRTSGANTSLAGGAGGVAGGGGLLGNLGTVSRSSVAPPPSVSVWSGSGVGAGGEGASVRPGGPGAGGKQVGTSGASTAAGRRQG